MDALAVPSGHRVTRWLTRASPALFAIYAVVMAFVTYFAMYSFRKPFAAAQYAGARFWILDLKSALVISQVAGYALSKMLGVKFNSEMPPHRRAPGAGRRSGSGAGARGDLRRAPRRRRKTAVAAMHVPGVRV